MRVQAVDDSDRLFLVTDLLPQDQCNEILLTDWRQFAWERQPGQEHWLRRRVIECERLDVYNHWITLQLPELWHKIGMDFRGSSSQWWIDDAGFTVDSHTDGELPYAMQVWWAVPGPEYGTGFWHDKAQTSLRYQFESMPNTGYVLLNHPNLDGSQPLQWHVMSNPVPKGTVRVSSYWLFYR